MAITKAKMVPRQRNVQRGDEIWALYMEDGMTQSAIAKRYGISQAKVCQIIGEVRRQMPERTRDKIIEDRVEQFDSMIMALIARYLPPAKAGDYESAHLVVKLIERHCRMLGLDAPPRSVLDAIDGKPGVNLVVQDKALMEAL